MAGISQHVRWGETEIFTSLKSKHEDKIKLTETGTYGSCRMRSYTRLRTYSLSRAY